MDRRRLILRNFQSPGDIVMLTAAVRDLHRSNPDCFLTDVRTSCGALWENNPFVSPIKDDDAAAEKIDCDYPLIHRSNTGPWHFIHGFQQFLSDRLKVPVEPTDFRGDIHLAEKEREWISQVQEITGSSLPFWIIAAGGKQDFTIKWWDIHRFQKVVNHFRGRIFFVQVGENGHHHPPLNDVLDLRGKTDLRQLVRLVYHSQGVLCPVTLLMHLAASVEVRPGMPQNRPCVVVAGGREPAQWEAYPHHQYIHTNGALGCCDQGGCWRSRTVPLGDGDAKDLPENLCVDVVEKLHSGRQKRGSHGKTVSHLPRCMDMITAEEVCRRIELYFNGGAVRYLDAHEWRLIRDQLRKATALPGLGSAKVHTSETPNISRTLDASWVSWVMINLERKCAPEGIKKILLDNGFAYGEIKSAMGESYPQDAAEVDYERLANVRITRPESGVVNFSSDHIQLYTLENFLDADECDQLVDIINGNLRPSTVTLESNDKHFRTSSTCFLTEFDSPLVRAIDMKIAATLGINPAYSEGIQAQKYLPGQQFKPHTDYFEPCTEEYETHCSKSGNRTWTFMIYLSDVEKGGGTAFTEIDHTFFPKKGMAVIWNNLCRDGKPNRFTLHSGEPVAVGEKIIITKWFREIGSGQMFP